jgi:hypothetical protein
MESDREHLTEHAVELVSAARRLADSAADPSTATHLPAALACWPATYGREGPSYERQAQLLSSLYEAGATLRQSRRACARANELLIDMTASGDPVADVHHDASAALG